MLTSLKSTVHEVRLFYCDVEISFIIRMCVNQWRVQVVCIGGSRFWVWGGGEDRMVLLLYCGFFSISCSASSVMG